MKTIVVKTQKEWDALPKKFDEYTVIEIRSPENVWLQINAVPDSSRAELRGSSRAVLWGSSRAELWGSSSAVLWGSSSAVLWESSSAVLWGSSRAELWGSSRAELWESSSAVLWGSSRAVLWGSSRAELRGSSRAELRGSSRAELWGSSRAELWGSSRAELWESSSAVLWESSSAECMDYSFIFIFSAACIVKKLLDYSSATFRGVKKNIEEFSKTAVVRELPLDTQHTFEEMLKRGYVQADGITKKLISEKKLKSTTIYTVEEFLENKESFVAQKGELFSHGETVEKAIEGLRYKLSDRDTTKYKKWKLTDEKPVEDLIQAYRAITGACEFGVKQFCVGKKLKEKYTIKQVIKLTNGNYGSEKFALFFGVRA